MNHLMESLNLTTIDGLAAEQLNAIWNRQRLETLPDDPPVPLEENLQGWRNIPEFVVVEEFLYWNEEHTAAAAVCEIEYYITEENRHMAFFDIYVPPENRRRGLGKRMLARLTSIAVEQARTLMITRTTERIPAGQMFVECLGASRGMEMQTNQLRLSELDRKWVERWRNPPAPGFTLGTLVGACPEELLEAIVALLNNTSDVPHGELAIDEQKFTPKQIRDMEQFQHARSIQRWTMYLQEDTSGRVAGLTEVMWNPNRPQILEQGFTGVDPAFRGRGLGRWLKAAMIDKVLAERPEVAFVRTGNANENAPMLKINTEMGFKPYQAQTLWQIETQKVVDYLSG
jgi:GNAT superfamily N-acetyltransferase